MNMVLARSGVRRFMANPVVPGSRKSTAHGQIIAVAAVVVEAAVVTTIIAVRGRINRLLAVAVAVRPDSLAF
jgi:hypothetical protein